MRSFLATTFIACLMIFGCTQNDNSRNTLRLAFANEVSSTDPRYGHACPANYVVKMLFEGLMRVTPDGVLIPSACESYTISEDQKTYTFTIRSAEWSNGKPVTAYDFEYAWKCVVNPETRAEGANDFYPIKNAEKIIKGELAVETIGIRAIDAKTLLVELEHPTPYFLELITTAAFSPVYADLDSQEPEWANKTSPQFVCNGPFLLKERVFNSHLVLEKNPFYWNRGEVQLEKIHISIVEDVQTQLAMFEKQQIDWFGRPFAKLPLDATPSLKKEKKLTTLPECGIYWYFLNTDKFPFTHQKIREAFALAIDRQSIVDHVLQEDETAATSITSNHAFFSDADIVKAQQLFSEALIELKLSNTTFPPVVLSFPKGETNYRIASVVQQQWKNVFGIQVSLDAQEWTSYFNNVVNGNYLVGAMTWLTWVRDPIYILSIFKNKQDRLNISSWEHPHFQELLNEAQKQTDLVLRKTLLDQAQAFLMKEMPVIPIYFVSLSYAKNKALSNFYLSETSDIDFAWAYKR